MKAIGNALEKAKKKWQELWSRAAEVKEVNKTRNKTKATTKQYRQTTMTNINNDDTEEFGDKMTAKQPRTFRLLYQNINNLTIDRRTSKSRQVVNIINQKQGDALLMTEVGLA